MAQSVSWIRSVVSSVLLSPWWQSHAFTFSIRRSMSVPAPTPAGEVIPMSGKIIVMPVRLSVPESCLSSGRRRASVSE